MSVPGLAYIEYAVSWVWDEDAACYRHGIEVISLEIRWSILFANHKANGVVTNIGLLANTVDDTGSYMAG